jgi:hypothetical protein
MDMMLAVSGQHSALSFKSFAPLRLLSDLSELTAKVAKKTQRAQKRVWLKAES